MPRSWTVEDSFVQYDEGASVLEYFVTSVQEHKRVSYQTVDEVAANNLCALLNCSPLFDPYRV